MSKQSESYLKGIPTKPYDLIREGLIMLGFVAVVVVVLAIVLGSPDYPTLTIREVAAKQPLAFLRIETAYLSGNNDLQTYGPPYTNNPENAQAVLGFISPQRWAGTFLPLNAQQAFALEPLKRLSEINPTVAAALQQYESATKEQQTAWVKNFTDAIAKADAAGGDTASIPKGDYGPVEPMMMGMLKLARAGLLNGALQNGKEEPYNLDNTSSLLFLQGAFPDSGIESEVAGKLDMQGGQWGISHEAGPYPGAWWLWPYTFLYQVPVIANSPNADLLVGLIITFVVLILLFLPVIPGLNRLPHGLKVYRLIWRDWYKNYAPKQEGGTSTTAT